MSKEGPSRPPYMLFFPKDWLAKTAGLSVEDTALALEVSVRTVKRDWNVARAWLYQRLGGAADD